MFISFTRDTKNYTVFQKYTKLSVIEEICTNFERKDKPIFPPVIKLWLKSLI